MQKNNINIELKKVEEIIKNQSFSNELVGDLYKYIFNSRGKQFRGQISLISSSCCKKNHKKRLYLAAIIELLHTATLVHDDIIDESNLRRGKKTVNYKWTNAHSVLIGDFIYSSAFILIAKIKIQEIFDELSMATNDISQGELMQLSLHSKKNISLEELINVSYFKTGRLFETAAKTGAMLGSKNKSYIKNISKAAKYMGILFQIKDDVIDYSETTSKDKPKFQDIKEGKITYPLYFALQNSRLNEKKYLLDQLGNKKLNTKKFSRIIEKLKGIDHSNELITKYRKKTEHHIKCINNQNIKEEMLDLLNRAIKRDM